MARPRQPVDLLIAKGKKNLTKAEIEERRATEVAPCADDLTAPSYLTAAEKTRFSKLAGQLAKIKVMGETDTEALARYVTAQVEYEKATKELRSAQRSKPKDADVQDRVTWANLLETLDKRVDRYFKQAATAAAALGLTISSRCKLIAPVKDEEPKTNKFAKFGSGTSAAQD